MESAEREGEMSQKVDIDSVRYEGPKFFLGVGKDGNRMYTRNPEKILSYISAGQRFAYNYHRGGYPKFKVIKDEDDNYLGYEQVGYLGKHGPGKLIPPPIPRVDKVTGLPVLDKDGNQMTSVPNIPTDILRDTFPFLQSMPSPALAVSHINMWVRKDDSADIKRRATLREQGIRVPRMGLKKKSKSDSFKMYIQPATQYRKLNAKFDELKITGKTEGQPWTLKIRLRVHRPVQFTKKSELVIVNLRNRAVSVPGTPKPLQKAGNPTPVVGIDRGIHKTVALSDGTCYTIPKPSKSEQDKYKELQRSLSRKIKYSKNYNKVKAEMRAISSKQTRRRHHWIHETTCSLAKEYDTIVLERLNVKRMTAKKVKGGKRKKTMNRNMLNSSWGEFQEVLTYKTKLVGSEVVFIDPAYTSQACNSCHQVHKDNRKSQAKFKCISCGHEDNADNNAALNIRDVHLGKLTLPVRTNK